MILAISIGNAIVAVGGLEQDRVLFNAKLQTDASKTPDQCCVDLKILLEIYGFSAEAVEGAILASVVPQALNPYRAAVRRLTGKEPLVVGPGIKTGLQILLENPEQMGANLVAADVAALAAYPPPLILVDMDTATTIAVLDKTGAHIGGCVCPGMRLSLDALTDRTALLPGIQLDRPKSVVGKNTIEAMRSGILYGSACLLDGMTARLEEELGYPATVVATGSAAEAIVPLCRTPIHYEKDLILRGLGILYGRNTTPAPPKTGK